MEARIDNSSLTPLSDVSSDENQRFSFADFSQMIPQERHWLLLLVPLLLSMIGPIQWLVQQWTVSAEVLGFQPFVPLGVFYLAWADRNSTVNAYKGLEGVYPEWHRLRRGTPVVAYIGCAFLLFSYITTISLFAVAGFWITLIGIILHIYGFTVLRTLWRPTLFALTMIPVPNVLTNLATGFCQLGCAFAAGSLLSLIYPSTHTVGNLISMGSYTLEVSGASSGAGIVISVVVLTLLLALIRRMTWTITLILMASAAGFALVINTVRIIAIGLIGLQNPLIADLLHNASPWFFTAIAFGMSYIMAGRIGPRSYQPIDDDIFTVDDSLDHSEEEEPQK